MEKGRPGQLGGKDDDDGFLSRILFCVQMARIAAIKKGLLGKRKERMIIRGREEVAVRRK